MTISRPTLVVHIRDVDNEPMLDSTAMMLLFGVTVDDVHTLPTTPEGTSPIPREWVRRGRQRAREAQAHTGSTALLDALDYWANRDHGAALTVVYD